MSQGVVIESSRTPASRDRVELILAQIDRLPTLPPVVARLLAATSAEGSSAKDVVEILSADAALTAALLRMVRRADLGARNDTMTVSKAVTLLGFDAVRGLAMAVEVFQSLESGASDGATAARRKGLWTHNLAVACLSEMISERLQPSRRDGVAFVCGLLHDIGKVALDVCLPKSYARVVEQVERERSCICDVERAMFGLDHALAGKRLVTRWGLSQTVVDCVWLHHQELDSLPSTVVDPMTLSVVHLADNLARQHDLGFSGYQTVSDVIAIATRLGVTENDLSRLMQRLPERMKPLSQILGLDDDGADALCTESLLKTNRELSRANEKLRSANESLEFRSRFLTAVSQFGNGLPAHGSVPDVCRAAAAAMCSLPGIDRCVAVCFDPTHRVLRLGLSPSDNDGDEPVVLDASAALALSQSLANLGSTSAGEISPAPDVCDRLWPRFGPVSEAHPLWVLPLGRADEVAGAVLFTAAESSTRALRRYPDECRAFSTNVGVAMSAAQAREEADALAEELLNINRRLKAGQGEALRTRSVSMIAKMAAGAAHELNNPLSVIAGRAQMALARDDIQEKDRALNIIQDHARRASQIVIDLMRFAKPEAPKPVEQSLPDVIDWLFQCCADRHSVRREQLSATFADPQCVVSCDAEHLREILSALAVNAIEAAGSDGVRLTINSPSTATDEHIRIVVRDEGPGMSREVLEHALDPFFSHREAGRGRGLGLSKAFRLTEINGGRFWIDSAPGLGTTVTLELPTKRMLNGE